MVITGGKAFHSAVFLGGYLQSVITCSSVWPFEDKWVIAMLSIPTLGSHSSYVQISWLLVPPTTHI